MSDDRTCHDRKIYDRKSYNRKSCDRTSYDGASYDWRSLDEELELWGQQGRKATFWWRDDDASVVTSELETLLQLSDECCAPVSLAVVPAKLEHSLCDRLDGMHRISILQHGFSHNNHAPLTEKKSEYGAHRPVAQMLQELEQGKLILQAGFREQFYPVLVPPWNRYSIELIAQLHRQGYQGVSAMWARPGQVVFSARVEHPLPEQLSSEQSEQVTSSLLQVNAHIDPVAWRDDRGFIGLHDAMEQLVCHLRLRREFPQLGDEPTGLLSHHLDQTQSVWDFCRQLADRISHDDNCCWLGASDIWC